ncbi:proline-rich receptor-like protein kinase PERK2 [Iris pallida]|uniref:Proline-rich receptor-like protein kinase PERK2 n=1 Tax=Iris pallida TaxID=29817 RepID=A0AAX6IG30_IRIPA|nr:proline-rich receptor-like protein kinase PERK2 [Iris pallida]
MIPCLFLELLRGLPMVEPLRQPPLFPLCPSRPPPSWATHSRPRDPAASLRRPGHPTFLRLPSTSAAYLELPLPATPVPPVP